MSSYLEVPAIEVKQGPTRRIYSFAIDGKRVPEIATISRIRRAEGALVGYQRPEILSHIAEIRSYLESKAPMIPNAIVLAFDSRVKFEPLDSSPAGNATRLGTIKIPGSAGLPDEEKPGFVVDGQQRLAAIRDANIDTFPILVTAFITDDLTAHTEQFMLVNSTRPLPKSLIYELLPSTDSHLPSYLQRRRFPAYLLERLNLDPESPLQGKIKTPTNPEGIIKDNSILRMLENSLSDGVLYRYRTLENEKDAAPAMLAVLGAFWTAVAQVFDDAWGLSARRSRLMHGAGVVSMGFLMDAIADRRSHQRQLSSSDFAEDLLPVKPFCKWTSGFWEFGPGAQRKWNELQNTPRDIQLLSNYLLVHYRARVWTSSAPEN